MADKRLIVFDMDGVLIDVSASYREAVRQTVRLFLKGARSWQQLPEPLFSLEDLAAVKQSGGLNNDWDLTRTVLALLASRFNPPAPTPASDPWRSYRRSIARCDVTELGRYLQHTPRPLTTLLHRVGKPQDVFVDTFYRGDVGSGNIIKQIFQEIYLGKKLFEKAYGMGPRFQAGGGYIARERLLPQRSALKKLARENLLAVATGRPRLEAEVALARFNLQGCFDSVLTHDECVREQQRLRHQNGLEPSLGKPHPFMLDAIAARYPAIGERYYVGDMPDDMVAARRARWPFTAVGALWSAAGSDVLAQDLQNAGADVIVREWRELEAMIASRGLQP